jgi:hypothetical protein
MIKVSRIEPLADFQLLLTFSDGTRGVLDCRPIIAEGGEMVEPLGNPEFFARVFVELGAPTWPNGYDIAPWTAKAEIETAGTLEPATTAGSH